MNVLATGNDLRKASLDMGIVGAALGGAMDDGGKEAFLTCRLLGLDLCFSLYFSPNDD